MGLTKYIQDLGRAVAFYPSLKRVTQSTTASILLCQLLYWTDKTDDGWIRKTSYIIEDETGLTRNEQRTARKILVELGVVEEVYKRLDHEIWFKVNQDELNDRWEETGGHKTKNIPTKREPKVVEPKKEVEKEKPEGDWLDIALGEDAQRVNAIFNAKLKMIETLERKFQLTSLGDNMKWMRFVDFAYNRKTKHNEDLDIFVNWALHNGFDARYWTPEKMKTLWGQAFTANLPDEDFVKEPEIVEKKKDVIPPPRDMNVKNTLFDLDGE